MFLSGIGTVTLLLLGCFAAANPASPAEERIDSKKQETAHYKFILLEEERKYGHEPFVPQGEVILEDIEIPKDKRWQYVDRKPFQPSYDLEPFIAEPESPLAPEEALDPEPPKHRAPHRSSPNF
ncbi:unnamed protein product [Cyprideis torosa]|uniref:Uncharacterized protein n=1 Tax=Cyprideis torosa TaxID=163714 RepID=A0A7R8WIZ6_9CRUS|nr:unnamed protein product [Cyprideis torosa]CAG0901287.1 unnamed protein product [Cyprideis torosa]